MSGMASSTPVAQSEAQLRAQAMERARASLRLEGMDLSPAALAVAQRHAASDKTGKQLVEEMSKLPLT